MKFADTRSKCPRKSSAAFSADIGTNMEQQTVTGLPVPPQQWPNIEERMWRRICSFLNHINLPCSFFLQSFFSALMFFEPNMLLLDGLLGGSLGSALINFFDWFNMLGPWSQRYVYLPSQTVSIFRCNWICLSAMGWNNRPSYCKNKRQPAQALHRRWYASRGSGALSSAMARTCCALDQGIRHRPNGNPQISSWSCSVMWLWFWVWLWNYRPKWLYNMLWEKKLGSSAVFIAKIIFWVNVIPNTAEACAVLHSSMTVFCGITNYKVWPFDRPFLNGRIQFEFWAPARFAHVITWKLRFAQEMGWQAILFHRCWLILYFSFFVMSKILIWVGDDKKHVVFEVLSEVVVDRFWITVCLPIWTKRKRGQPSKVLLLEFENLGALTFKMMFQHKGQGYLISILQGFA